MEWIKSRNVDELQWGYIAIVAIIMVLIYGLSWRRRNDDAEAVLNLMGRFEDLGIGVIYQLVALLGVAGMAWMGWRLPGDIEAFVRTGMTSTEAFPLTSSWVGRVAQIFGAVGLAAVAMRSMRYVVPVMIILLGIALIAFAAQYVMAVI